MTTLRNAGLLLGAASLSAASLGAQTITPLIVEGDVLPHGVVTATYNMDVNDSGDWLVELDTDNTDTKMDNAVVFNGAVIHQEGTSMGFPASHASAWVYDSFVDTMDINDNGDRLIMFNAEDVNLVLSDTKLVVWTNGSTGTSYTILEQDVTPCTIAGEPAGAVWDSITEVWQNNNNEFLVAGRSNTDSDTLLVHMTHDGAGNILTQTAFGMTGVNHAVAFPPSNGVHATDVQGFTTSKQNIAFNNAGQKMFYVDDDHTVAGGDTNFDAHYYVDTTEIAWEGDDAPTTGTWPYNHLSSAEVDINDVGTWVAVWDDDNTDTSQDFFINVNGTIFQQEGQAPPGIGGGFVITGAGWGHVQISDAGDITWMCDWDDPDTTIDSGLFRNNELLVQEGVTLIGGVAVDTISTSSDGGAVSDNGQYILHEFTLDGSLEGVYMIEVGSSTSYCFGDGSGTACPCGNNSPAGEGCLNGTGSGAIIESSGSASVALGNLSLDASQCPTGQPGLMFQGVNATNAGLGLTFGDGLRCAGGSVIRLQTITTDGSGNASTTIDIGVKGEVAGGDTRYYQFWYRDPAGSTCGQFFNLSNGLEITWGL